MSDLKLASPLLIVCGAGLVLLLAEAFGKGKASLSFLCSIGLLAALGALFVTSGETGTIFGGLVAVDPLSWFIQALILSGSLLSVLVLEPKLDDEGIDSRGEFYALLLFAVAGAMVFSQAAELVTLFVSLEVMSLALYALCGSAIGVKRSSEAALKYFLLGSFASAFLLYGVSLMYGLTGSTVYSQINEALAHLDSPLALVAMALILVGILFKVGAAPFHFWVPDVYQGAPTGVTAFMACVIKVAAFGAALRVLWLALGHQVVFWSGILSAAAVITMFVGNLAALRQKSIKRMLAYSSVAHAGYMTIGLLARGPEFGGGAAVLYYLTAYTLMTLGAFAVVLAVTASRKESPDEDSTFSGLGYRKPILALLLSLFMLSLAGLPPGMAGLLGKFYLFNAAVQAHYTWLAFIGVINSAISCYYYLRIIVVMYFGESSEQQAPVRPVGWSLWVGVSICAAGVVLLGVFPWTIHDPAVEVMRPQIVALPSASVVDPAR